MSYVPRWSRHRCFRSSGTILLVFCIWLVAGSAQSFAQSTTAVEIVNDSIIVDVKLDAGRSARMLLDTGAQTTTFSRAAASRLNLETTSPGAENSLFSGVGTFKHISIGSMEAQSVAFGVLKLRNDVWDHIRTSRGGVDGSLGLDFLSQYVFGIDMPGGTLTIWKANEFDSSRGRRWFDYLQIVPSVAPGTAEGTLKAAETPADTEVHIVPPDMLDLWLPPQASIIIAGRAYRNVVRGSVVPSTVEMNRRENGLYTVRGELDGFPFVFDLDTGSNRLTLPPGFAGIMKPVAEMPGAQLSTIDATESVQGCIYHELKLGGHEVKYPYALASGGHSAYTRNPTIGMGLLSDCKLLFDFPGRTLSLARIAPNADAPRRKLASLGIFLVETEGRPHVYVGKGSPGERAGLHDGDGLVKCEGLPPAQPDDSITVRQSDEAQPVAVTVRRAGAGETQTFTFDHEADNTWIEAPQVATFPPMPDGCIGAKRFPTGGVYVDSDRVAKLVKPGGSVLFQDGRYFVAYHDTAARTVTLNLPKERFQIIPAKHDPGKPPFIGADKGLIWIGGVGWVVGPVGSHVELDGFTVTLRPSAH